jgi:hypothetical protein
VITTRAATALQSVAVNAVTRQVTMASGTNSYTGTQVCKLPSVSRISQPHTRYGLYQLPQTPIQHVQEPNRFLNHHPTQYQQSFNSQNLSAFDILSNRVSSSPYRTSGNGLLLTALDSAIPRLYTLSFISTSNRFLFGSPILEERTLSFQRSTT